MSATSLAAAAAAREASAECLSARVFAFVASVAASSNSVVSSMSAIVPRRFASRDCSAIVIDPASSAAALIASASSANAALTFSMELR